MPSLPTDQPVTPSQAGHFPVPEPLLIAKGVTKRFGGVVALSDGCFTLRTGEVHAIMGENGAGKSTLGKILAGVFPADSGQMLLDGKPFTPANPQASQASGVAMIFQELDLFPHLSVAENMVIANRAFDEGLLARRDRMLAFIQPHLHAVGFQGEFHQPVGELSIGDQQLIAIARALSMEARILVMDESTSALTEDAVQVLFSVIRNLKAMGVSIIYVSHKMDEIFAICDHVTVLRDGATVGDAKTSETDMARLIQLMVGREVDRSAQAVSHATSKEVLRLEDVSSASVRDVDFSLHAGEVLGIAGLVGAGRSEIGRILFGLDPLLAGKMTLADAPYEPGSVREAKRRGVGLVPEDRKGMGLMMQMSVRENSSLSVLHSLVSAWPFSVIQTRREAEEDRLVSERTRLKSADPRAPVHHLSGGNQQKVLLGRWLQVNPDVLFLDDPTRGVDVGAKEDIYRLVEDAAEAGKGVLVVSSELPELLRCCDRILVMNHGRQVGEVNARATSQEAIMQLAAAPRPS